MRMYGTSFSSLNSDTVNPAEDKSERPPIEKVPSPQYSKTYGHFDFSQDGLDTEARIASIASLDDSMLPWLTGGQTMGGSIFISTKSPEDFQICSCLPCVVS